MTTPADCSFNIDPLKLVREGTSQDLRMSAALDPQYAPVNERRPAHGMVFAQAYSKFLKYYNSSNGQAGHWEPFFSEDVSVQLAVAAVENVEYYRQQVNEYVAFLNHRQNENDKTGLRDRVDFLFSSCVTLAIRLNRFMEELPEEIALRKGLRQLVQSQLAPALRSLIAYHKGGETIVDAERPLNDGSNEKAAPLGILGVDAVKWSDLATASLSKDWTGGMDWGGYYGDVASDASVYGNLSGTTVFERANHLATHNLFNSVFDQFLKVYARTVSEANLALEQTLTDWDRHEPHYALFLAFLRLFEHARAEANTLTGRHLDFYYRNVLRLAEKSAVPGHAHLLLELSKQTEMYEIKAGELFKAGKDDLGIEAFFANDRDVVVNQAKVAVLKTVYHHGQEPVGTGPNKDMQAGRLYASPVSNSDDGVGAPLTNADQSWHPFHNKIYRDGILNEIRMQKAEVGFAIASHYLWLAEGTRTISISFVATGTLTDIGGREGDVVCLLTSEKGWIEVEVENTKLSMVEKNSFKLEVKLEGEDPAVAPYSSKTHGYRFATTLPVLLVKLRQQDEVPYIYKDLQDAIIDQITVNVHVEGLKTLAASNDFGPVDTSKPFQPFGALPTAGSALIIGSKEVFQKELSKGLIRITWMSKPLPYGKDADPKVSTEVLKGGKWEIYGKSPESLKGKETSTLELPIQLNSSAAIAPDFEGDEFYGAGSRSGFVKLKLDGDFGQAGYQASILEFMKRLNDDNLNNDNLPGNPPVGPSASELALDYTTTQTLTLNSVKTDMSMLARAHFFHVAPFGQAEQHPILSSASKIYLFPQFKGEPGGGDSEAELYIGVSGLKPPQNLALLFQIADGTADPLSKKPDSHLHWSYLRANEWMALANTDVDDQTGGLLNSGIITLAIPRDASDANTLLPSGMHWIRAAVASKSDAVCRLILVAAQALKATFVDKNNDPAFSAKILPAGTISKLDRPTAAVKSIMQPFATFNGRGTEEPKAFYTRISERLRHKDRAIVLWDYERLILEAFPQIYRAKCLNHTQYEPTENGSGLYRELAPGHVTVVTIPNQQFQNLRDPLRPYTSLGLLEEIGRFLRKRLSCFVTLHVKNPQCEEVLVGCRVRLREGWDETFYETKLREAITRFLSPWAFPGGGYPSFGGKIYKSVLINFVEDQPYVDYVTDVQLFHVSVNGEERESNEVEGSNAVSILVSVPAREHRVQVIKPVEGKTSVEQCPCEA
jgi:hypothetical protein